MYYVVTIDYKQKIHVKSKHATRVEAVQALKERQKKLFGAAAWSTSYEVLGPRQVVHQIEKQKLATEARKKKGAEKAAKTREKNRALGREVHFIVCPICGAKSKKLYSEMGGLQTRRCKNGHLFEVDTFFGFETTKRQISSAARTPFDSIDPSYMQRRYGNDYKG